jgi:hypothetical protein
MPLVKNGHNKSQVKNAIMRSLDEKFVPTKAQAIEQKRGINLEELSSIYDNMHYRRKR